MPMLTPKTAPPRLIAAICFATACFAAMSFAVVDADASPTPLKDTRLPLSALREAEPRIYHLRVFDVQRASTGAADGVPASGRGAFTVDSRELGTLAVTTQTTGDAAAPLELIDRLDTDLGTKTVTRIARARGDAVLSPTRVRIEAEANHRSAVTRATFRGRRVAVDLPGKGSKEKRYDWPVNTVTMSGLLRLAPLLPRRTGERFAVAGFVELFEFEPTLPEGDEPFVLQSAEVETIRIGSRGYGCLRYVLDMGSPERNIELWVDREGKLRQFVVGGKMRGTLGRPGPIDKDPVLAKLMKRLENEAEAP